MTKKVWEIEKNCWGRICPRCFNVIQHVGKYGKKNAIVYDKKKCLCLICRNEDHSRFMCGKTFHKGKKANEESKKRMSISHIGLQSGEKHPMYRKKHSNESKIKMGISRKGKCVGTKHYLKNR